MLIEDQEALRNWLTTHLEPLCDADPAALAKYVLALIKKDKSVAELKDMMVQQMDVFLQAETISFIDILFKVVENKEYLLPVKKLKEEEENEGEQVKPRGEEVEEQEKNGEKQEADSTTPLRDTLGATKEEPVKRLEEDERRRLRRSPSPPPGRRRHLRSPPRRFRERSLSPRHDRFRVSRRGRSPPPPRYRGRPVSRSPPLRHRPRSLDRSPIRRGGTSRDSTPTRDEGGYNPSSRKIRCRDYDEKGFCLRGDLCKFDHGSDAVVLEDGSKPGIVGYQPGPPPEGYIPSLPSVIPFPPPVISVPPPGYHHALGAGGAQKRPYEGAGYDVPSKRFNFARLGGRGGRGRGRGGRGGGSNGASRMLAVRNIPAELNTITHLNTHFCRFGMLQNIQVQFEGDPNSALVTFATPEEANQAFSTAEAVLNNRFIKVFWHMDVSSVKERLGQPGNNHLVMVHGDRVTKTVVNEREEAGAGDTVKEEKERAIQAIQKNQEMMQTKAELLKKADQKRKEAMKQQEMLINSKQELLSKLIEQQKALIAKLEKSRATIKPEEKATIMGLIKELSASIDRTKDDLKTILTLPPKPKTRQEIQKDLLDAEMELFQRQQDGTSETAEIQKRVNMLRLEAAKSGLLPTSRPARGRGGYRARGIRGGGLSAFTPRGGWRGRGRGRGFTLSPGSSTLDRRPSRILVSGYELDEKDDLIANFQKFGEITDIIEDEATPSVILKYKTRRLAEAAMLSGKVYGDRTLHLAWYNQGTPEREGGEAVQGEEEETVLPDDDYTPPQHDYLPPGLQEHEDSLSQGSQGEGEAAAGVDEVDEEQEDEEDDEEDEGEEEEVNEAILDDDDEEGEQEERSWKRRKDEED